MMIKEVPFIQEDEEEEIEPLTLEHFYFPLIILSVGLVISTATFIAEIIFMCLQKNDQL